MNTRLLITLVALGLGLTSFQVEWKNQVDQPPVLWFHQLAEPQARVSDRIGKIVRSSLLSEESRCNQTYVQYLERRRSQMLASWSPLGPLQRIVSNHNPGLGRYSSGQIAKAILQSANRHNIDPFLLAALIAQESRFRPSCVSPGGAVGLGQILPATAASMGINPYDATQNVEGCARYLGTQMRRWRASPNKVALALASYNAGPGAVEKYGGVPPYRITQKYVAKITARQKRFLAKARESKKQWVATNGPVMKDLYGKSLISGRPSPKA